MTAPTPWLLWILLTIGSVVVGGLMLWIAFAAVNKRQRQQGFEVKPNTTGGDPAVLREKEHHG